MTFETLPAWFWAVYYLFFIITLRTAIFYVKRKRMVSLSTVAIGLSIVVPIANFFYSLGRKEGLNEFEHYVNGLQQGDLWSIILIALHLYLVVWWVLVIVHMIKNNKC